jgi:hypothetical protein
MKNEVASCNDMKRTKPEKKLHYEAQLIVQRYGKSFEDALEIAKASLRSAEVTDQAARNSKRREAQVRAEKKHDERKRGDDGFKPAGLPMQGGAPGLGKRR